MSGRLSLANFVPIKKYLIIAEFQKIGLKTPNFPSGCNTNVPITKIRNLVKKNCAYSMK